jgi:uncharacterized protein (DUF2236 family)
MNIPEPLRHLIGQRIRQMTGSTQSPDSFKQPVGDPGLLGPQSMPWKVHAHFISMMVGGLSSLMLQALHPRALAAVWDHSNFRHDLKGRLGRTAYFVAITTYGGREQALSTIERVNRIHASVHGHMPDGSTYVANEPELLRWVHLGEVCSFLKAYQSFSLNPLSRENQDQYVAEMALIGRHLGAEDLPLTQYESQQALLQFLPSLRYDDRTKEIIGVIENYPAELFDRPFLKLVIQAAFDGLPDWALAMMGRTPNSPLQKLAVSHALRLLGLPIQAVLDQDGVAAYAKQRMSVV